MPDGLEATLAALDAAVSGCAVCGQPCDDSPSDDFCSEDCQRRWACRCNAAVGDGFRVSCARLRDGLARMSLAAVAMEEALRTVSIRVTPS